MKKRVKFERIKGYKIKRDKNKILDFFNSMYVLKNTIRTGWVKYHGMKEEQSESVADHVFSVSILAYLFAKEYRPDLDADKVLKMLLFHEFEEVYTNDIPLRDFVDRDKLKDEEEKAVKKVFSKQYNKNELFYWWYEFRDGKTAEAKFALQFDKLEAVLQAYLYNRESGAPVDFKSFIEYSKDVYVDDEIIKLIEKLKEK